MDLLLTPYKDINSGGEDLSAQQLRRAAWYGPYIELLDRLAHNEDFQCIRDPKSFNSRNYKVDLKENDRELVLRAFAFKNRWMDYTRPIKKFLNSELDAFEQMDEKTRNSKLAQMEDEFKWVMRVWRNVFGASDGAFRKWEQGKSGLWGWGNSTVSKPLWDVMYLVLAELRISHKHPESVYLEHSDKIMSKLIQLFESGELELSGLTVTKFASRKDTMSQALKEILPASSSEARRFSDPDRLRRHLFEQQAGKCSLCGGAIEEGRLDDGSYVHLDHKKQFRKGGPTTADNAGLAHRACNLSKG
mmetsp:Transcript_38888/g.65383  ORF Transcript_38888/g.65383 Transcript_38888/m.65383 type:complete len:303 (+) Transcript_38888:11-919(+)